MISTIIRQLKIGKILTLLFLVSGIMLFWVNPAKACCNCKRQIERAQEKLWIDGINLGIVQYKGTVPKTTSFIKTEFTQHKQWLAGVVWEDNILPAMMMLTDEIINVGLKQVEIFGSFMDAKIQLETQQAMQIEKAKIHKLYTPSTGICEVGTAMKSMAYSERKSEITQVVLSQRALDRHTGSAYSAAHTGIDGDSESRLAVFKEKHCNGFDNKNGMEPLCGDMAGKLNMKQRNRDIDFARLVDMPWTINIDFTDSTVTQNEEDILAMASTIYGNNVIRRPLAKYITNKDSMQLNDVQNAYMDARALQAKRSVAENSFNAITSMKSSGGGASREYLVNMLGEFGINIDESDTDITAIKNNEAGIMLGEDVAEYASNPAGINPLTRVKPSYYAQMEILTKKMFQNPSFFTNLYDKPANVDRKTVAMQAIGLMQKFDVFKSYLRQEAAVSVMLELAVMEMQSEIENQLAKPPASGNYTPEY